MNIIVAIIDMKSRLQRWAIIYSFAIPICIPNENLREIHSQNMAKNLAVAYLLVVENNIML
jgi:hypothetical protein